MAKKETNNYEIFERISESKVNLQLDTIKELKNRAGVLLGFTALFLSIVLTSKDSIFSSINKAPLYLILLSFFLFSCCLFVKNYSKSPKPKEFYEKFKDKPLTEIRKHLIEELNQDFEDNNKQIKALRKIINFAIWVEVIAIMLLTAFLFPLIKPWW